MEFIDLKAQQQRIKQRIDARIADVLAHGQYIMGPEVSELEHALARFTGARHCIACASGTTALELVLSAWGIGTGDAVFTTPLSFIATAEAIAKTGATPIFVDIDPNSYNINPANLNAAIMAVSCRDRSRHPLPRIALRKQLTPRAVVLVDLFGNPVDYDPLLDVAHAHNLLTLEDGAQGFGSMYKGRHCCNCGCDAATTSFFPAKPLGCYGDGGAVFCNDNELANIVDSLRYHGRINAQNKNDNIRLGCNGRIDTLQAAILLAKLEIFPEEIVLRAKAGQRYTELLLPYSNSPGIVTPTVTPGGESIWAQYTIKLPQGTDRPTLMKKLREQGIPTAINYPKGMHTQGCLRYLGYTPHDFPHVQEVCSRVLSLPMHPYLTEDDQKTIVDVLIQSIGWREYT